VNSWLYKSKLKIQKSKKEIREFVVIKINNKKVKISNKEVVAPSVPQRVK
jgi:hypothetical protein